MDRLADLQRAASSQVSAQGCRSQPTTPRQQKDGGAATVDGTEPVCLGQEAAALSSPDAPSPVAADEPRANGVASARADQEHDAAVSGAARRGPRKCAHAAGEAAPNELDVPSDDAGKTFLAFLDCLRIIAGQLRTVDGLEQQSRAQQLTMAHASTSSSVSPTASPGEDNGDTARTGVTPVLQRRAETQCTLDTSARASATPTLSPRATRAVIAKALQVAQSQLLVAHRLRGRYAEETATVRAELLRRTARLPPAQQPPQPQCSSSQSPVAGAGDERRSAADGADGVSTTTRRLRASVDVLQRRLVQREQRTGMMDEEFRHHLNLLWTAEEHYRGLLVSDVARHLRIRFTAFATLPVVISGPNAVIKANGSTASAQPRRDTETIYCELDEAEASAPGRATAAAGKNTAEAAAADELQQQQIAARRRTNATMPSGRCSSMYSAPGHVSDDDDAADGDGPIAGNIKDTHARKMPGDAADLSDELLYQLAEQLLFSAPAPGSDSASLTKKTKEGQTSGGQQENGDGGAYCPEVFALSERELHNALESRDAVLHVEQQLLRLHQLFSDVSVLVTEQGQQLECISHSAETAHKRVAQGRNDLKRAKHYKRSCGCGCCAVM